MLKSEKAIIFFFYVFCYTLSTIYYIYDGYIYGDLRGQNLNSIEMLVYSYITAIIGVTLFCWITTSLIKTIKIKKIPELKTKKNHTLILTLNILFISFSIKYNFGFSGLEVDPDIPKYILYLFIILQPQFLSYIYLAYHVKSKSKIYYLNIILILLFSIYKGWLESIVFISLILFMKNKEYIFSNKKKISLLALIFVFLVPFLKASKTILMSYHQYGFESFSDAITSFIEYNNFKSVSDFIITYIMATINRFEHVSIIYYINETWNSDLLHNMRPAILEGWPNEIIGNILGLNYTSYIQQDIAHMIQPLYSWQVQIPITARIFIEDNVLLYLIYILSIATISIVLSKIISNSKEIQTLNWFVLFSFLFHGWNYSMILWIQALFMYICISIILIFLSNLSRIKR